MSEERPFSGILQRLRGAGLRPTKQRLALGRFLFNGDPRHVTAEQLHRLAAGGNVRVSLATVYNTLHQFTEAGLLREVVVEPNRSYFDTNTAEHHHFYAPGNGGLTDIPAEHVRLQGLPLAPAGTEIERVDVIVRVRQKRFDSTH